ncbi:MAG TPA: diguanylate cyclase [Thermoleophilaceae bacterium]|nr:diguanylate cyclase [Thermoleophilaceae bacterium]
MVPPRELAAKLVTALVKAPADPVDTNMPRDAVALRAVLEGLPDAVVAMRPDGTIDFVNERAEELFGYEHGELVGQPVPVLWPERLRDSYLRTISEYVDHPQGLRYARAARGLRKDGSEFVGEMSWGSVETESGVLMLAVGRDISARLAAEARLRRRAAEHAVVASLGERALAGADPAELCTQVAEAVVRTMEVELAQVFEAIAGQELRPRAVCAATGDPAALLAVDAAEHGRSALVAHAPVPLAPRAAASEPAGDAETELHRAGIRSGLAVPVSSGDDDFGALAVYSRAEGAFDREDGDFLQAVANVLATAEARRRMDDRLRHQALHDPLTGLANRTLCHDRLTQAVARARRSGAGIAVLYVDLDDFKSVNDEHGHAAGDAVLAAFGHVLEDAVRPSDTVARLGGDEFVVICESVTTAQALALGERLAAAARLPIHAGDVEHRFSASVGIAFSEADPPEPDALVRAADAAAYRAKRGSGSDVHLVPVTLAGTQA